MLDTRTKNFIKGLDSRQAPVFILGPGGPHSLGFVRSLGKRGIPVMVASLEQGTRLRSRYCLEAFHNHGESALLTFIEEVGRRMPRRGVMIPTADAELLFMSRNRSQIGKYFCFELPDSDTLEMLANKRSQYKFAARLDVAIPQTYYPEGLNDILKIAKRIEYPCIIKPVYSYAWQNYRRRVGMKGWTKLAEVTTPKELCTAYSRMTKARVDLLVQERIKGDDTHLYSLYTYLNRYTEPLAALVIRKQRQWPPVYGSGSHSVTCINEDVVELGLRLLKSARYKGSANLEFKQDPEDGKYKLIEVNVRCGERVRLAVDAGIDIPYIAYRDILGKPVTPVNTYSVGIKWINLINDFGAFIYYHRLGRLSFRQWTRSVMTSRSRAYFSWDDPVPFFVHLGRTVAKTVSLGRLTFS